MKIKSVILFSFLFLLGEPVPTQAWFGWLGWLRPPEPVCRVGGVAVRSCCRFFGVFAYYFLPPTRSDVEVSVGGAEREIRQHIDRAGGELLQECASVRGRLGPVSRDVVKAQASLLGMKPHLDELKNCENRYKSLQNDVADDSAKIKLLEAQAIDCSSKLQGEGALLDDMSRQIGNIGKRVETENAERESMQRQHNEQCAQLSANFQQSEQRLGARLAAQREKMRHMQKRARTLGESAADTNQQFCATMQSLREIEENSTANAKRVKALVARLRATQMLIGDSYE